MVNWHPSNYARLEFAYGYGSLDRFGITGATQFFQTGLQLTLGSSRADDTAVPHW